MTYSIVSLFFHLTICGSVFFKNYSTCFNKIRHRFHSHWVEKVREWSRVREWRIYNNSFEKVPFRFVSRIKSWSVYCNMSFNTSFHTHLGILNPETLLRNEILILQLLHLGGQSLKPQGRIELANGKYTFSVTRDSPVRIKTSWCLWSC